MNKPTIEEMRNVWMEDYEYTDDLIHHADELVGRWRHGTEHLFVAHRKSDHTYWGVYYRTDKDGDYNNLRDDDYCTIVQVKPIEKVIIEWKVVNNGVATQK